MVEDVAVVPKFIPGWVQIRHRMRGPNGDIINTFSATPLTAGRRFTGAELTQIAANFASIFQPLLAPLFGVAVQFIDVVANDLGDEFGESGSFTYPSNTQGTSTGEQLPANVAIASTWRTKFRGRAYRGRNFWGGFTEAATNGDLLTAAFQAALTSVINVWLSYRGPTTAGIQPVVASRVKQKLNPITAAVLTYVIDSQRRRLTGHGR
jgi:hypothetical protein